MPKVSPAQLLARTLNKLRKARQTHANAIAKHQVKLDEIDAILAEAGIEFKTPTTRRGPKPGKPAKAAKTAKTRKRTRGKFNVTGEQSILDFIKSQDKPSTQDINKHWIKEGRGGKADNTLTRLVKAGQLKRLSDPKVRGSMYALA